MEEEPKHKQRQQKFTFFRSNAFHPKTNPPAMAQEPSPKPGVNALVAMKNLNNSLSIFKVPQTPQQLTQTKKKDKMTILCEEQYVEELGKIIEKDFFPDLEKLRAQNQYLDAVERNDMIKMRALHAKYSGNRPSQSRCESPATFETPVHNPDATPSSRTHRSASSSSGRSTTSTTRKTPSSGHTLDSFLTHFTSEDNNSFHEIIEASDRKLRQKFAVLYAAEGEQAKQMALALALPDIEKQFEAIEGPKRVETWSYKNKNYIMYVPEGVDLTVAEKLEMAKRRMEIAYENTRLQHNPFDERQSKEAISELAKSHAKTMCGRIGVDGNYIDPALNGSATGSTGPQIRGFGFVKTPSPCPGVDQSPLMTWGEIEGTPFCLDGSDTPLRPMAGPSFRINETSRRETIALELADKACERKRGQKARAIEAARRNIGSPHVRSTLERLASMSPAAKRLASGRLGSETPLTPSPHRRHSSVAGFSPAGANRYYQQQAHQQQLQHMRRTTPSPQLVRRRTPAVTGKFGESFATGSSVTDGKSVMTDDLLKIPGASSAGARKQASDFF